MGRIPTDRKRLLTSCSRAMVRRWMDGWMDAGVQLAVISQSSSPLFFSKLCYFAKQQLPSFFAKLQLAVILQNSSCPVFLQNCSWLLFCKTAVAHFFCKTATGCYFAKQQPIFFFKTVLFCKTGSSCPFRKIESHLGLWFMK
jgi:hypothetical protein